MLLRSGAIVAVFTLLSRIFGMLRELFIATTFGTGFMADSVNVAFKLPNLFRRIFGEGALSSIFVPMFSAKLVESPQKAERFATKVLYILTISLVIIIIIMQIFMPQLMFVVAPGFRANEEQFALTVLLCRITMPYLLFVSLVAIIGGMLNSLKKFAAFAFSPVIMNIVIIAGGMLGKDLIMPAKAVAISLFFAGVLQLLFMLFCLKRSKIHLNKGSGKLPDKDIQTLFKLMLPATISSGATQINLFLSQSMASFIPGAVSILAYADRIYQLPMSVIGVTFGTILLPTLARYYKNQDFKAAETAQNYAIQIGLALSLPCSIAIIILANPIIAVIYEHGAFTANDTINTADTLSAYALGLPAFILSKIFTPIFYANQDAKTPMQITISTIICNIAANLLLMHYFGFIGIALGSTLAAWFNVALLAHYAKKNGYYGDFFVLRGSLVKIFACSSVFGISASKIYDMLSWGNIDQSILAKLGQIFISSGLSFIIFLLTAYLLGLPKELKPITTNDDIP